MASKKYSNIFFITGILLLALIFFYPLLIPGRCLFTTDDNLGMLPSLKNAMPQGIFGNWNDAFLLGGGGRVPLMWTPVFLWLMPEWLGFNWLHASDLLLASICLAMFLRAAGLHWMAVALGALAAFWVGSNLSLTYAGHLGKYGVLMFAAASLFGIRKTFEFERPWLWSIVTGGLVGFMFLEQQDVALFFGFFWGAYALFRAVRMFRHGAGFQGFLLLIPMGGVALLMSAATLLASYTQNVGATDTIRQDSSQAKWEFITQWSWPPEESIDFIAPGYMGWRSSEADGPYWGRMGRSAGWETTGQGFMNFKLENQYLGAIPLIFALFAVFVALLGGGARSYADTPILAYSTTSTRAEIIFWFCAAILALLLSFGKYFPLYYLFYQLPLVGEIRNPNKFLQVFQLALGILAAYGAHLVFNWPKEGAKAQSGKVTRPE